MNVNDPTTPLHGLPSQDQPTINRPPSTPARGAGGFTPGTIVAGRYRIVALLGKGGMGEVYRGDDLRLGQPVALKFVDLGSDARSLENLYHEVRMARQVSHPNVCRVHDVVEADGLRFIAMEYVDGEDLGSLLRRFGRLPADKATEVARDIASGLAAAHDRGITHRDLKPANVMIDGNGRAHVTDFGLASLAGAHDGRIAGTPAYMAPEQVAGEPVTPRTDVYALGLLLHELSQATARLLGGRFRDPMVGRELLLGVAGGIVSFQIYWGTAAVRERLGHFRRVLSARRRSILSASSSATAWSRTRRRSCSQSP